MSCEHHKAARVFIGFINDQLAAFISVLHFPHPKTRNIKKVHRLVVLPDYQGAGIGIRLLDEIGKIYLDNKQRFTIVTSAPSLMYALKRHKNWRCTHKGRSASHKGLNKVGDFGSANRLTTSWELIS